MVHEGKQVFLITLKSRHRDQLAKDELIQIAQT